MKKSVFKQLSTAASQELDKACRDYAEEYVESVIESYLMEDEQQNIVDILDKIDDDMVYDQITVDDASADHIVEYRLDDETEKEVDKVLEQDSWFMSDITDRVVRHIFDYKDKLMEKVEEGF